MTKDNQDALRCAEYMEASMTCGPKEREAAAHLRRLVAENEGMKHWRDAAVDRMRELESDKKAKDALLKQAVDALEQAKHNTTHGQIAWNCKEAITAIRQHRERNQ